MSNNKTKPSLSFGWEVHQSKTFPEMVYYFNRRTRVSSWTCPELILPADSTEITSVDLPLPPLLAKAPWSVEPSDSKLSQEERTNNIAIASQSPPCVPSSSTGEPFFTNNKMVKTPPAEPMGSFRKRLKRTVINGEGLREFENPADRICEQYNNKPVKVQSPVKKNVQSMKRLVSGGTLQFVRNSNGPVSKPQNNVPKNRIIKTSTGSQGSASASSVQTLRNLEECGNIRKAGTQNGHGNRQIKTAVRRKIPITAPPASPARFLHGSNKTKPKQVPPVMKQSSATKTNFGSLSSSTEATANIRLKQMSPIERRLLQESLDSTSSNLEQIPPSEKQRLQHWQRTSGTSTSSSKQISPQERQRLQLLSVMNPDYCPTLNPSLQEDSNDVEMVDLSDDCINISSNLPEECNNLSSKSYRIVVDTNVLIANLKFVDELKDSPLQGCGPPIVVIPYMVLQELDKIKNNKEKSKEVDTVHKANEAVRYIYEMFEAQHPRVCGQDMLENSLDTGSSLNRSCNDDMILNCCLQLIKKVPRDKVILLTNDKNLCNKAMVWQITAYTTDTLHKHLEVDFNDVSTSATPASYPLMCGVPSSAELHNTQQMRNEVDRIMVLAKASLKIILGEFLEREMKSIYGNLWLVTIYVKPPWSLQDILDCLMKHWIAVFTFLLDKPMKTNIQHITSTLRSVRNYVCDEQQALEVVNKGLPVCTKVAQMGSEASKDALEKLTQVQKQLQCLVQNNPSKNDNSNKKLSDTTKKLPNVAVPTTSDSLKESWPKISNESDENVTTVFQFVWNALNHICGVVLDSLEWPHKLEYQRRASLPSKDETNTFIPVFYPQLCTLKTCMFNVVKNKGDLAVDKYNEKIKGLFMQLHTILPALNIFEPLPARISEEDLKSFCANVDNKDFLSGGLTQLNETFVLIHKCIIGTAKQS